MHRAARAHPPACAARRPDHHPLETMEHIPREILELPVRGLGLTADTFGGELEAGAHDGGAATLLVFLRHLG